MERALRELVADGLEDLGEIELGGVIAVGDPVTFLGPAPAREQARVRPGTWRVLGRPWEDAPELLGELILVHADAIRSFYDLYDALQAGDGVPVDSGRVAALDAKLAGDDVVLKSLYEPEELPWILDRGLVAAAVPGGPAVLLRPASEPAALLSIALGPKPAHSAPSLPDVVDSD